MLTGGTEAVFVRPSSDRELLLRALLDGPVAIAVSRIRDGAWLRVNDAFLVLTGHEPAELLDEDGAQVWADAGAAARLTRALRRGVPVQARELSLRCRGGDIKPVLLSAEPLQLGGEECALFTVVDITLRKQVEEDLRRAQAELSRKGGLLAALSGAQRRYLDGVDAGAVLEGLLAELVRLTGSGFGAILEAAEVPEGGSDAGSVWLTSRALTDLADSDAGRAIMQRHLDGGVVLTDPETLFGRVAAEARALSVPGAAEPHDLGGLPPDHPPLASFLGLPLRGAEGGVVGVLALANRQGGYPEELVAWLEPAVGVTGSVLQAERSVRAQRRAEEALAASEERFRLLVDGVRDYALIMLDPYGRVSSWNAGAEAITGHTAAQALGLSTGAFYPEEAQAAGAPEAELAAAAQGGHLTVEGLRVRRGGERFWASVTLTSLHDAHGRLRGFAQLTRDVTHRKQLERLKDEFVSVVSHELRTPLTAIRGALGLLEGGVLGEIPEAALEVVGIARGNCERLVRLVSDILDLQKIEAGHLELRLGRVALGALVPRTLERMAAFAGERQVTLAGLDEAEAAAIQGDEDRVEQVLTNLISNAIKFSPAGADVRVRVRAAGGGGADRRVRVEVIDRGPGVPADKRHLLFGKFQQLDGSDRRKQGGTGLGLAICKAIVEAHGGRIGIADEVGAGACFWFELPAWPAGKEV